MLNAIGLDRASASITSSGRKSFVCTAGSPTAVFVNIAGKTVDEFFTMAEQIGRAVGQSAAEGGLAGLELNLSCPNVYGGVISRRTRRGRTRGGRGREGDVRCR